MRPENGELRADRSGSGQAEMAGTYHAAGRVDHDCWVSDCVHGG